MEATMDLIILNGMASNDERSGKKVLTMAEVQQLAADTSKCIMVINNHVYDITRFMDEHPGGEEVLKEQHGRDATDAFEDVGHSVDAREQMKSYEIGELDPSDAKTKTKPKPTISNSNSGSSGAADDSSSWTKWVIPLVIAVAAVVLFKLLTKSGPEVPRPPPAI